MSAAANCSSAAAANPTTFTAAIDSSERRVRESAPADAEAVTAEASPTEGFAAGVVERNNRASSSTSRPRKMSRDDPARDDDGDHGGGAEGRGVGGAWGDDSRGGRTGADASRAGDGGVRGNGGDLHPGYRGAGPVAGADAGNGANDGALDFVFFEAVDDGGVSCGGYEVRREFSQQRFADGYPSVTEFDVSCPSLPDLSDKPV